MLMVMCLNRVKNALFVYSCARMLSARHFIQGTAREQPNRRKKIGANHICIFINCILCCPFCTVPKGFIWFQYRKTKDFEKKEHKTSLNKHFCRAKNEVLNKQKLQTMQVEPPVDRTHSTFQYGKRYCYVLSLCANLLQRMYIIP